MSHRLGIVVLLTIVPAAVPADLTRDAAGALLRRGTAPTAAWNPSPGGAFESAGGPDLPIDATLSYKMLTGSDFHSLDYPNPLLYFYNTGGAVGANQRIYSEAGIDLPDGAALSEVTFIYKNCSPGGAPPPNPWFYFGAYSPERAAFTYYVPLTPARWSVSCDPYLVDQAPIDPAPTVDNSQNRYVAGFFFRSNPPNRLLVGVRVGYSLP